ncbi:hypothetical protein DFQ28_006660 [Apophysomyces sp. BC1034]|nr:hypothetical protein DFQ30_004670 [Apophysomyces sp. BC1015]KAG0182557.1 hypothetical protein DFQ29_003559 [Apophysomyces sp. BC1021]KAG0193066.1 hypothetical protein DFQ28_006660 [Apophysomyces sp. BC1034]
MSFNIGKSFVSRAVIAEDKEQEIGSSVEGTSKPETEYDPRTLYERLQEQRDIKEELFQEQTRLSNLIKRIDDDEAEYFQTLSDVQEKLEEEKKKKEDEELEEYRKAVEQARTVPAPPPPASDTKSSTPVVPVSNKRKPSKNALEGLVVVKKKREAVEKDETNKLPIKKAKTTDRIKQEEPVKRVKPSGTLASLMVYADEDSSDEEE